MKYDLNRLRTPCYFVDRGLLQGNLDILAGVQKRTGCKILLALKGFAMWSLFGQIREVLAGVAASALFEARLGRETFGKEVHLCAPAYRADEMEELLDNADHMIFNSLSQWRQFRPSVQKRGGRVEAGLRLNPRHSEVKTAIYDPCGPGSRLGIPPAGFQDCRPEDLEGVSGFHFHTLCELNADALARTLPAVEKHFGRYFKNIQWLNFGGGHHITRPDYDVELLCRLIVEFRDRYGVQIYLEPGEAIALNTGFLASSVLDIIHNDVDIAILDTSASAHMPDVLEMPYRPRIENADLPGRKAHTYRLAGPTCLAGDVIGDYSFDVPLRVGEKLLFHDMAHYTMVKNTMFNGIQLPDIVLYDPAADAFAVQRRFSYEDFKSRLS